jgi:O-antigen/teichoic acid export membrane protein
VSRTVRASIAAGFSYLHVGISVVASLWLVPFTLEHVGARGYGLWLASGELLAYAGLAELGMLVTLPWLVAQADGQGDRARLRKLVSTGAAAASLSAVMYAALALLLWTQLPRIVRLAEADRIDVQGPLLIVAIAGCLSHPLRAFSAVLAGLQDVRFNGLVSLANWSISFVLAVSLLALGHGLYALAVAASVPPLVTGIAAAVRLAVIAPDLLRDWPRPSLVEIRKLFVEGLGTWIGGWGWRLVAASDSLVLAALGRPADVAVLACTTKLAQAMIQLSWIPCDNGLIGLAQLSAEGQSRRLRDALVVMVRVYLSLAGAVACVVIAVNAAFVREWVGPAMFAGAVPNLMIAALAIAMSFGHAVAVIPSVLGRRLAIGLATMVCGVLHVGLAWFLGSHFGVTGIVAAGVASHGLVFSALAWKPFAQATGTTEISLLSDVLAPWATRMAPMLIVALLVQRLAGTPPLPVTIATGALVAATVLFYMRPLYIEFGPVRTLYERVLRSWRAALGGAHP